MIEKKFNSWSEYHDWLKANVQKVSVMKLEDENGVITIWYEENK